MKKLSLGLPSHIIENMIVINSDTPGENRKWMRRNNVSNLRIYSDEKMNWMKTYTMHGIEGLSIAIFIIADERVHKIAREVHGSETMEKLTNMVRSLRKK
mmetsp:Transcript_10313/g.14795  ORF Transcript_10313/g.14795 Transcript_10313/m.14795 type:complete len:100 (+) Transcript_10313:211-510(+)